MQALRIGTGTYSQGLASYTKDILINNTSLFGDCPGKVVTNTTSVSCNYNVFGVCFVLTGLPRPKRPPPSKGKKQKTSSSLPFHGRSQSESQSGGKAKLKCRGKGNKESGKGFGT